MKFFNIKSVVSLNNNILNKIYSRITGRHPFAIFFGNFSSKRRKKALRFFRRKSKKKKGKSPFQNLKKKLKKKRKKAKRKKRWRKRIETVKRGIKTITSLIQKILDWLAKVLSSSRTILLRITQILLLCALLQRGSLLNLEVEQGVKYIQVEVVCKGIDNHELIA